MEILGQNDDAVDIRLSRDEARALYNLLVEAEGWPQQALGARPLVRTIREALAPVAGAS